MKRYASAQWRGALKSGRGTLSTASSALNGTAYSFGSRFEEGKGTNPEELVAAAHAGCFSMALSAMLEEAGNPPQSVQTEAELTLEKQEEGWTIVSVHLMVSAVVPGLEEDEFREIAAMAKSGCPISRLLKAEITLEASLAA